MNCLVFVLHWCIDIGDLLGLDSGYIVKFTCLSTLGLGAVINGFYILLIHD